jgi:YD repeat-containing protein
MHRVLGKGYGAQSCPLLSPVVTYTYDSGTNAKGKLTSLTDQAGTASYSYDVLGRLTGETRVISGMSKSLSYGYTVGASLLVTRFLTRRRCSHGTVAGSFLPANRNHFSAAMTAIRLTSGLSF